MAEASNTNSNDSTIDLASLERKIAALTTERDSLLADLKDVRHEARDRRHEAKGLSEQLAALTAERDDFKAKAETTSAGWQSKIDALTGTVRGLKHERTYAKVAHELKVRDQLKFADLVKLSGYQADADDPDESKITEAFKTVLKDRPWLAEESAADAAKHASGGAAGAATGTSAGKAGAGSDRGQSLTETSSRPARADWPAGRL
jgi:hypothetical protein